MNRSRTQTFCIPSKSAPSEERTHDLEIKSLVQYQLRHQGWLWNRSIFLLYLCNYY